MKGDLLINGIDAWKAYGMNFEDGALASLLTPPPMKEFAESKSRLQHGAVLIVDSDTTKFDSRDVNLQFHIVASSEEDLMTKYASLCNVLRQGKLELKTKWSDEIYRMVYNSCSSLSLLVSGIMKFTLKMNEPNPNNRGPVNAETEI